MIFSKIEVEKTTRMTMYPSHVFEIGPTLGNGVLQFKLVLAKDAVKGNGNFPRTPPYVDECQYPEALDPVVVQGSVVYLHLLNWFLKWELQSHSHSQHCKAPGVHGVRFRGKPDLWRIYCKSSSIFSSWYYDPKDRRCAGNMIIYLCNECQK